jgi:hypothetical protein
MVYPLVFELGGTWRVFKRMRRPAVRDGSLALRPDRTLRPRAPGPGNHE